MSRADDHSPLPGFGLDEERVALLVDRLRQRGETVAAAESLTAGLVTGLLTSVPGASAVVRGGLVVYGTDLKGTLAGVDTAVLDEHGPVHPEVARRLGEGARRRCGADWGLGLTGVAGPDPQNGVPPGVVHVAVAGADEVTVRTLRLSCSRHGVRAAAVRAALDTLGAALDRAPPA
ncbi:CinA family protein [Actinoalloteichus caeruleus]|uniref:CinA family protein n=1 Tax=Actinoalloteichus cyanogriseus TaxID=2893586 RepID=UPI0009DCDCCD|nr:nicotinamide-nucleotide amidohydrolase family protein [Actinoalloteichus caeruleus]